MNITNRIKQKQPKEPLRVGKHVYVTNYGETYPSYEDFSQATPEELIDSWNKNKDCLALKKDYLDNKRWINKTANSPNLKIKGIIKEVSINIVSGRYVYLVKVEKDTYIAVDILGLSFGP